jgi:hypothetical protein
MVDLPPALWTRDTLAGQQPAMFQPVQGAGYIAPPDADNLGDARHAREGSAVAVGVQADNVQHGPIGCR